MAPSPDDADAVSELDVIDAGEVAEVATSADLVEHPSEFGNDPEARFAFVSAPPGASSECSLDGGEFEPCRSPWEVTTGEGEHTLVIRVFWPDGEAEERTLTYTWRVDLTPPISILEVVPPALDNSVEVTFSFTTSEPAVSSCRLDWGPWALCNSPHTITELGDGEHRFEVRSTDDAGNEEEVPAYHEWQVDSRTPDTRIDSGPEGVVADSGATFAFSSPNGGVTFECALDAADFSLCESPWELFDLEDGEHTFAVRTYNVLGVVDPTPAERSWVIDTTEPIDAVCGAAASGSTRAAPTSGLCASGTPSEVSGSGPYRWSCHGSSGGATVTCSADRSCDSVALTWSVDALECGATVEAASHGVTITASDDGLPTMGYGSFTCDQGVWIALGTTVCVAARDGVCGAAADGSTVGPPVADLCHVGVAGEVSGDGPYTWPCAGVDGGTSTGCSSNRSCEGTSVAWSDGEVGCEASIDASPHGQSATATDATLPERGSHTFTCDQGAWLPGSGTCVAAVDGSCGEAAGGSTPSAPDSELCAGGDPSAASGEGPYQWTCLGTNGGADAVCSSNRGCVAAALEWSVGVSQCLADVAAAEHGDGDMATDIELPTSGSQLFACEQGVWVSAGEAICVTALDGACGAAAGASTTQSPTSGLCASGVPSEVSGDGPYDWTCAGVDGGDDASCAANRSCAGADLGWSIGDSDCGASVAETEHGGDEVVTDATLPTTGSRTYECDQGVWTAIAVGTCVTAVDGVCGSADGGSSPSAPGAGLCDSGSASTVSGSGPFTWTCQGSDGGSSASCSADRSCVAVTLEWTVDGSTCSGSVTETVHNEGTTLTDAEIPTTGSRTYTCDQGVWTATAGGTCVTAVDGACGAADGGSSPSAPSAGLCASGSVSTVIGSGPFTWTCDGMNGGSNDNCASNRSCIAATLEWTVGGSTCSGSVTETVHDGATTVSDAQAPTTGSQSYGCDQGTWTATGGGTCVTAIDGVCGSADGDSTLGAPTSNLCASGTASSVTGSGPYLWTCSGLDGGASDSCSSDRSCSGQSLSWTIGASTCSASIPTRDHDGTRTINDTTAPSTGSRTYRCDQGTWGGVGTGTCVTEVDGVCGSADGGSTINAPTTNLCASGTPSGVSGSGPFTWTCSGSGGGAGDSCSSDRSCASAAQGWTVNGYTCSATISTAAHDASRTAVDSTLPDTGSNTYSCDQGGWVQTGTATCVHAVDGVCGDAAGGSTLQAPTSDLCASGAATQVTGTGPFGWSCLGSNGGDTINCSSHRSCAAATPSWSYGGNSCKASSDLSSAPNGASGVASDGAGSARGHHGYVCGEGQWYPTGTGTCVTAAVSNQQWPDWASFSGLQQITYAFSVTGNPTAVECRVFNTGSINNPSYTPCSGTFTSQITEDDDYYWIFQLRVSDGYSGLFEVTRRFWNNSLQ